MQGWGVGGEQRERGVGGEQRESSCILVEREG